MSSFTSSAVTKQQAYDQCKSCKTNPTTCIGYNNGPYACYDLSASTPTGAQNAFKMSYATGCNQPWADCPTASQFPFTGTYPTCGANQTYNPAIASCACNAGYVMSGGSCVVQPPNCTASEITQVCDSSSICTGTYQSAVNCWLPSAQAPAGCESGVKTDTGCPANCLGGQTENPVTHVCEDPVCVGGQTLDANHYCQDPTCIGGQTFNSTTHSCDEPVCGTGYTVNTSSHVCEFSGCPTNTSYGTINGVASCIPKGDTTTGTAETTQTTTTDETSTTTTNPDGSQTTTTTGTDTTTGTTTITFDTKGLAQESTMNKVSENTKGILDKLNEINTTPFAGGSGFTDQYTNANPNTYTGITNAFTARLQSSQIGQVATGLFDVNLAGTCPVWTIPASTMLPSMTIDQFCGSVMNDIWPFIQAVMLAVATALAIRVAFF